MAEIGWIKLHRKLLDSWVWKEKPFDKGRAWVDLLLLAAHKDMRLKIDNKITKIAKGSFLTSTVKLSERWGWSRNKVLRFLDVLECEQMLKTKRTRNGTVVTVVNYGFYQVDETTNETMNGTTNGTADETADGTQNKKVRNKELYIKEKERDKEKESTPPQKHKHGEYKNVLLTDEELAKIKTEYPTDYEDRIENLSSYLASKNVSYKSHYAVIRRWAREDAKKKEVKDKPAYIKNNPFLQHQQSDTDYDAIEKALAGK